MLCDMCIVHLNVSYNFKRQAVENDVKLHQYLIEQGLMCSEPESLNGLPPSSIIYSSNISVIQNSNHPRTNMVLPIAIKTEVIDDVAEVIPDDITDMCVDTDNLSPLAPQIQINEIVDRRDQNKSQQKSNTDKETRPMRKATPSPTPSMVIINGINLCDSGDIRTPERESRDNEFMKTYVVNTRSICQKTLGTLLPDTPSTSTNNSPPSVKSASINPTTKVQTYLSSKKEVSTNSKQSTLKNSDGNAKIKVPLKNDLKWMMKLSLEPKRSKLRQNTNIQKEKSTLSIKKTLNTLMPVRLSKPKEHQIKKVKPVAKLLKEKNKIGTFLKSKLKATSKSLLGTRDKNLRVKTLKADKNKQMVDIKKKKSILLRTKSSTRVSLLKKKVAPKSKVASKRKKPIVKKKDKKKQTKK